jgi:8-hydroxy-5-deazaflavin:NADPH oxidoreductase
MNVNRSPYSNLNTIAILGGTGREGIGLAFRWAKAGFHILIGSRLAEKATAAAQKLLGQLDDNALIEGFTNFKAAAAADIVVLTVPYAAHRQTLESVKDVLQGKILVDVTVPLAPLKLTKVQMPPGGSAALEAREILGENVQVTSAFQNISYQHLLQEKPIDCEVLVTGTSREARSATLKLVTAAGMTGWDAGPLENSVVTEGLTSVLIYINKQYNSKNAGIKIIGAEKSR